MEQADFVTLTELQTDITRAWDALWGYLLGLTDSQWTELRDAEDWTAKDHLTHLVAWEESVLVLFQDQPRYAGLGVDEALYASGSFDRINAAIQQERARIPLDEAKAQLRSTHAELMRRLAQLSDAQLNRPAAELFAGVLPGERRSLARIILDNTAEHFDEHLEWVRAVCEGPAGQADHPR